MVDILEGQGRREYESEYPSCSLAHPTMVKSSAPSSVSSSWLSERKFDRCVASCTAHLEEVASSGDRVRNIGMLPAFYATSY